MEKTYGPLKRDERRFFRAFVELIRPFLRKVRTREADVLAELLYHNYRKQESVRNKQDRFKLILDHDNRREMEDYLGISEAVFRNALSGLRQRGILLDDNTISDAYLITKLPEEEEMFTLKFNFLIEN